MDTTPKRNQHPPAAGTWLNISLLTFIISGVLVLFVALVTVGYKTMATAKSDPVKALRYE